jgi:hypothetical protein
VPLNLNTNLSPEPKRDILNLKPPTIHSKTYADDTKAKVPMRD